MDEDEDGGGFENVNGVFLDFNRVMSQTDNKYNLTPRKTFCGADFGSDYGLKRTLYDEYYMQEYERNFIRTSDGLITLPEP